MAFGAIRATGLSVLIVSTGTGYVRWLFDRAGAVAATTFNTRCSGGGKDARSSGPPRALDPLALWQMGRGTNDIAMPQRFLGAGCPRALSAEGVEFSCAISRAHGVGKRRLTCTSCHPFLISVMTIRTA